jgi:D-3-phosphoglycerate dehydrogenase
LKELDLHNENPKSLAPHDAGEKYNVLITDRFDIEAMALLRGQKSLNVQISEQPLPNPAELARVHALVIRSRTKVGHALLDQAPHLKMIVSATSGFDHIDLKETKSRGLCVMHTPDANAASAAELTWALVLACARRVTEAGKAVRGFDWKRESLIGTQLNGKTYGIVGLGRIGKRVAQMARAFGMNVVAFDPYIDADIFQSAHAERMSLDELLKMADVVSVHVPKSAETQRMFTLANLEELNHGTIFVNTSRGSVVSEKDLCHAIEQGWIKACGLDVFEIEPLSPQSKLNRFPNVVLTPHLGATTVEAFSQASVEAARKVMTFFENGSTSDTLPPATEWYIES